MGHVVALSRCHGVVKAKNTDEEDDKILSHALPEPITAEIP